MNAHLAHITLLVKEYDEAINFYINTLDFKLIEDTQLSENKRWVLIAPKPAGTAALLLAKATDDAQLAAVGNQAGGRVFLFLHTTNFDEDYERLKDNDVEIVRGPIKESYGRVLVFRDLYGNKIDLIER